MLRNDTICAIATPPGIGGLAVIRLSGEDAFSIAEACFRGKLPLSQTPSHTIHYGLFRNPVDNHTLSNYDSKQQVLDTVTASVFRAPNSYTGEHVVEIGCHGGMIVAEEIVSALVFAGARPATAGEFTKRAFLNGKLDLTQAEAVAELIHASSVQGSRAAAAQLLGGFTAKMKDIRSQLIEICGLLELELDFSEEDIEFVDKNQLHIKINEVISSCEHLTETFRASEVLRSGFNVAIVGFPNAGKSSLLNALLDKKRAIVSEIPGTTRDYLRETTFLGGISVHFVDTAGFRASEDRIELEGIALAEHILEECHCILVLNDASLGIYHSDSLREKLFQSFPQADIFIVQNKIDEIRKLQIEQQHLTEWIESGGLVISALTGEGLLDLRERIRTLALHNSERVLDVMLNSRHAGLLSLIIQSLKSALLAIEDAPSNEFIALDVRQALRLLGEITGEVFSEEVLNDVFAKFCIGK